MTDQDNLEKLIDEDICENVGCEYGEYDSVD